MKTLTKTFSVLLLASVAGPLFAEGEGNYRLTFDDLDTDMDGKVSEEEAQAGGLSSDMFKQYDADQDGYLTEQEVQGTSETPTDTGESDAGDTRYP